MDKQGIYLPSGVVDRLKFFYKEAFLTTGPSHIQYRRFLNAFRSAFFTEEENEGMNRLKSERIRQKGIDSEVSDDKSVG